MSTDTLVAPDELTLEGIALPCDIKLGDESRCDNAATWVGVFKCCGHVMVICDDHHDKFMAYMTLNFNFKCGDCAVVHMHASPFASLERL